MRIDALKNIDTARPFEDLREPFRSDAWEWYRRILRKRQSLGKPTRGSWLRAILLGQAKRLALNPPTSAWGRSILAKRGGYAVQQKYQRDGRIGDRHPAHRAARVGASLSKWIKELERDAEQRQRGGLPSRRRYKLLPLN